MPSAEPVTKCRPLSSKAKLECSVAGECCRRRIHVQAPASYTAALLPNAVAKQEEGSLAARLITLCPVSSASAWSGARN